jgi:hypothetical protein
MWVSKFGFKWKIGNGRKVEFWGNNWLDPNLAIQHWDLYTVVNEKKTGYQSFGTEMHV